jgi:hypothetical protein
MTNVQLDPSDAVSSRCLLIGECKFVAKHALGISDLFGVSDGTLIVPVSQPACLFF